MFQAGANRYTGWRARVAESRRWNRVYRIAVAVVGVVVLALGILAIPYPGPGWLIVFAGLGILASEFDLAKRVLRFVRHHYDRFMGWYGRQNIWVRGAGVLLTGLVVLVTLWVLGAIGLVSGWFGFHQSWLQGPFG